MDGVTRIEEIVDEKLDPQTRDTMMAFKMSPTGMKFGPRILVAHWRGRVRGRGASIRAGHMTTDMVAVEQSDSNSSRDMTF